MEIKPKNQISQSDLEEYLEKLKNLPPIDSKTETLLRALANALLDRVIEDYNNSNRDVK